MVLCRKIYIKLGVELWYNGALASSHIGVMRYYYISMNDFPLRFPLMRFRNISVKTDAVETLYIEGH